MAKSKVNRKALVVFIFICLLTGYFGSVFTTPSIPTWYVFLNKPFFTPPAWLFGPVWTILYILMGVSAYRIWSSKAKADQKHIALRYFFIQLAINFVWSLIFFGLKNPMLAFIDILSLLVLLTLTIDKFKKIDNLSAYLLYPYLAWGLFATALNLAIVILN